MTRMAVRPIHAAIISVSLLFVCVPMNGARAAERWSSGSSAQATWFDLYDEAIQHVNRREWSAAEKKLVQAKAAGPSPGRRVRRYGVMFAPFFPDFYLGVVYQNTGRPAEALAAFKLARAQDVDTRNEEFRQLDTFERTAEAAVARADTSKPAPPETPSVPGEKTTPEAKADVPANPGPAVDVAAVLRKRFDDLITTAESQLRERNYASALASAGEARDLDVDRARAETLIQSIQRANLSDQISAHLQNGELAAAKLQLDQLSRLAPDSPEVRSLTESLRDRTATLNAQTVRVAAERTAMTQFFAGDYQRALEVLVNLERNQPLSARGYFYRACSLAALVLRSETVDASRLAQARADYARSAPDARALQADRRFISPRILEALVDR